MKSPLGVLGWLVAIAAIIAAGVFFTKNQSLQEDLDRASTNLDQIKKQLNALESHYAEAEEAQTGVEEPHRQMATADPTSDAASPTAEPVEDVTPTDPEADDPAESQGNAMNRAARAQMGVMVGMQYNSLLDDLALPAETRDTVNDILIDAFMEAQQSTVKSMMSGTTTAKEAKAQQDAIDARVRERLSEVLDKDQLAQWDTYQDFADEVLYESLLDGQLAMLAPGLSEETRQTAKIVLAEDLAAELDRFFESDAIYTLDSFNQAQLEGLNQGMVRIPDTVSEEQYAHLTNFIDQVAAAFQQMAGQSSQNE